MSKDTTGNGSAEQDGLRKARLPHCRTPADSAPNRTCPAAVPGPDSRILHEGSGLLTWKPVLPRHWACSA